MMKPKKLIGNTLMVLGSVILLISLLAMYLPTVENRQTQLIVASFQAPSSNPLIQWMNNGMNFAMEHSLLLLLIGIGIVAGGVLLILSARTDKLIAEQTNDSVPAAVVRPVPIRPAAPPQNQPVVPVTAAVPEANPFARYMKDDALPKSTVAAAAQPVPQPAQAAPADTESSHDDILNIWSKMQEQPDSSDELFIQPVRVEDDEAYRRPEDQPEETNPFAEAAALLPEITPIENIQTESKSFMPPDTNPASNMISDAKIAVPSQPETAPATESVLDTPRPLIRSTFRKSTTDQPAQDPAESAEIAVQAASEPSGQTMETFSEKVVEAPALQPASRIKSTMGRKR